MVAVITLLRLKVTSFKDEVVKAIEKFLRTHIEEISDLPD